MSLVINHYSIAVPDALFDLHIEEKLFSQALRFHRCTATSTDCLLRLQQITGYQKCFLFFKLIKHSFL